MPDPNVERDPPRKIGEDALVQWLKLGLDELRDKLVLEPPSFYGGPTTLEPQHDRGDRER